MLHVCFRRASGVLLGLLCFVLPGWGFAQEFATDRLYLRQHGKARCLRDVKEYVKTERGRSEHTAEHDRLINNNIWYRFRKGVKLGEKQQQRFQEILNGQHRKSAALTQQQLFRNRAALAKELRDTNIRVHVICPGGVETEMITQVRPDIPKEELIAPQEIADLILYLVTHRGNAVVDELHIRRTSSMPWG